MARGRREPEVIYSCAIFVNDIGVEIAFGPLVGQNMADNEGITGATDTSTITIPDLMNDPAYDTNTSSRSKNGGLEAETCRICRAEGTDTEPLFYPCKCSGSIKFVHQEW